VATTGTGPVRVDELVVGLQAAGRLCWERRSCGRGAKGQRWYDWAVVEVSWPGPAAATGAVAAAGPGRGFAHHLLIRRSVADPTELAYFAVHTRTTATLTTWVEVVGRRWAVEDCFALAKSACGLDHYEVRRWDPWHRHITLAMLAAAFLSVTAALTPDLVGQEIQGMTPIEESAAEEVPDEEKGELRPAPSGSQRPAA
jgi:hypothetical protein